MTKWSVDQHNPIPGVYYLLPGNLDVIVCGLRHEELSRDLHFSSLGREVAKETAFLLYQEELRQLLRLGFQDLDPLLQLWNEIVQLHGAGNTEVKICVRKEWRGIVKQRNRWVAKKKKNCKRRWNKNRWRKRLWMCEIGMTETGGDVIFGSGKQK